MRLTNSTQMGVGRNQSMGINLVKYDNIVIEYQLVGSSTLLI